jgi:hypothetical protein
MTGCHKSNDISGAAEATIKTTALASITVKYPDLVSSDLKFSEMHTNAYQDGKKFIFLTFDNLASAKTIFTNGMHATTTETITVRMTPSGKVLSVYSSSN